MSARTSRVLQVAIVTSFLAVPMTSSHAGAGEVRVNQVTSTVSTGDDGLSGGLFGNILDKVLKGLKDQKNTEDRNRQPQRPD
jgi:F0F1-type ATP synthase gamma subunit